MIESHRASRAAGSRVPRGGARLATLLLLSGCQAVLAAPDAGRGDAGLAGDAARSLDGGAASADGARPADDGGRGGADGGVGPDASLARDSSVGAADGGSSSRDASTPASDGGPSCPAPAGCEPIVSERAQRLVADHAASPFPARGDCWGDVTWAFSALHQGRDVAEANRELAALPSRYAISADPTVEDECYWALPLVARTLLHPVTAGRLTAAARDTLLDVGWTYIRRRSQVDEGLGSVWEIHESENHDAMRKSHYLLFAQALRAAGRGADVLADGLTVENHFTAWQRYFKEYFRQRAREGINAEVASPIYGKYTLAPYYNLGDFANSGIVRRLARDFLTLYWADLAQDFLPSTGVRGGGMTRVYKDRYTTRGTYDGLRPVTWMYGWHEGGPPGSSNPATLAPATSDYRPPPIVDAMATRAEPHQYISRRFGLGATTTDSLGIHYRVTFESGSSLLRRFTWWTPEYVLGTLTFDPSREYIALLDQNRWMGVVFATDPDDRIAVIGRGDGDGRTGYAEITGITGQGCAVVARDPDANRSVGTRIFVSYGAPWSNRVEEGGWLFTRAGGAYAAVRPASGGWVVHSVEDGKMLDMVDMWAPVVIQMGRAADYADFAAFRGAVRDNLLDYDGSRLRYRSEAGELFEVHSQSETLPAIDGRVPSLAPAKTYSSPYILGRHGEDTVTLSFPGMASVILDFSY